MACKNDHCHCGRNRDAGEAHTEGYVPTHAPGLHALIADLLADHCEEPDEVAGDLLSLLATPEGTGATLEFLSNAGRLATAYVNADGGPATTPVHNDHLTP